MSTESAELLREQVRERYAQAARAVGTGSSASCGDGSCCDGKATDFGEGLYSAAERAELPDAAALASLGCGNPTAVADLREGEVVLDLGSGGGIDVILSAKRIGPTGTAYGLDFTDEMLALAQRNAAEAGVPNVHFLKGAIEQVPLPAESVDVVISNCVINLSVDKPSVLTEMARVLRPGGRLGISDVVAEDRLSPAERAERGTHVGCIAGALSKSEYVGGPKQQASKTSRSSSRMRSPTACTARSSRPCDPQGHLSYRLSSRRQAPAAVSPRRRHGPDSRPRHRTSSPSGR